MRRINRGKVLATLRGSQPMSLPALSKATGLSRITVDAVAAELLSETRVAEAPERNLLLRCVDQAALPSRGASIEAGSNRKSHR